MGIFRPRGVRTFFFVFVSINVPTVEEQHCGNKPRIAISKFQKHIAAIIAAIAIYPSISVTSFVGAGQIQVYRTDYITDTTNFQSSSTNSAKVLKNADIAYGLGSFFLRFVPRHPALIHEPAAVFCRFRIVVVSCKLCNKWLAI